MPEIRWLSNGSRQSDEFRLAAFRLGLNESRYIEGQNVTIKCRWAQGQNDRLPALAADRVGRQSTAIAAVGPRAALAAKGATQTIPIVLAVGIDPVQAGLVASFNRPGGNLTGTSITVTELTHKRLGSQIVPSD
jgi:putative tryptophan/tyrosine transport system substrate-binding protein